MSLKFIEGFDHYGSRAGLMTNWAISAAQGSVEIVAGRYGGGALEINQAAGQGNCHFDLPAAYAHWRIGFAFRTTNFNHGDRSICYPVLIGAAIQVALAYNTTGQLAVYRGDAGTGTYLATSTPTMVVNTWHYLEWEFFMSAGTGGHMKVHLDEVEVINISGVNTQAYLPDNTANQILLYGANSGAATKSWDDMYFQHYSAAPDAGFLGDVRVKTLIPTSDGAVALWTPNSGISAEACDDATPDDDTSYITGEVVDDDHLFNMSNILLSDDVKGVQVSARMRKETATARSVASTVRTNGTTFEGTPRAITQSYVTYEEVFEENPVTSDPWTPVEINALEAGVRITT